MLQIRKIKPEDIDFVLELTKESGCPSGKLLANIENFLICESNNIKCGCGCLIQLGSTGLISWVMVKESYRRQKLGGAITKSLLNIAEHMGIKEVYAAGICGDFLVAMDFAKCESKDLIEDMSEKLGYIYEEYFKVALEGYFKPCSHR